MLRLNKKAFQRETVQCIVSPRERFSNTHFYFHKAPIHGIKTPEEFYQLVDKINRAPVEQSRVLRYVISADDSRPLYNGSLLVASVSTDAKKEFNHCDLADIVAAGGFITFLQKPIEIAGVKRFISIDDNDGSHAPQQGLPRVALCFRALGCGNILFFEEYSKKSNPKYAIQFTESLDSIFKIPQERA